MILHLVPKGEWDAVPAGKPYVPASFATDGFIHCTDDARVLLKIANQFYKDVPGEVLLLTIDENALTSPVKWEAPVHVMPVKAHTGQEKGGQGEGERVLPPEVVVEAEIEAAPVAPSKPEAAKEEPTATQFPHIYGPLNREAIVSIRKFLRAADGAYTGYAKENLLPAYSAAAPSAQATPVPAAKEDPLNPLNIKTPSQMADELLEATDGFSEALNRFKDRVEGRIERLDDEIKKRL
jgi:uncharacterized protein (DUF952 family)